MSPRPNLTNETRCAVVGFLTGKLNNGKLCKGAIQEAAEKFKTSKFTIYRIWNMVKGDIFNGIWNANSKKKGNVGRKRKDWTEKLSKIKDVPLSERTTMKSLSHAIGIPKTTLFRIFKEGDLVKRVSTIGKCSPVYEVANAK